MRIRRSASKLLGLAAAYPSSSSSSPPAAACSSHWPPPAAAAETSSSTPAAADEVIFCQLNCSPWDVMTDLDLLLQGDDEGDEAGIKLEEEEEEEEEEAEEERDQGFNMAASRVSVKNQPSSPLFEVKKKAKQKKTVRRKNKEEAAQAMHGSKSQVVVMTCKKTDGKSWHCKRPAQPPHTLCHHHLDQLRSYSCSASAAAVAGDRNGRCRRKKMDSNRGADANAFYYYYSGFGPWRGKTRGGDGGRRDNVDASEEEEDEDCGDARELTSESAKRVDEDDDAPVAGGDEESESVEEDNGNVHGEGGANSVMIRDGERYSKFRKRGRKAVKARSLKSLL